MFPYIGGRAYRESAKFAVVIAEVVARHMDCMDDAAFKDLREQMRRAAVLVYGSTLAGSGA